MRKLLVSIAVVGVIGSVGLGCRGKPRHRVADASQQGIIKTDHIGLNDIRPVVADLCAKVSKINAQGWPGHVLMSNDPPYKPQIRLATIKNKSIQRFDLDTLRSELTDAIVEQGAMYLAASGEDLEAALDEADYSQSGMTDQELEMNSEERTALVLTCIITDDVLREGRTKQHDYIFSLRLTDTVKRRVVASSKTTIRKVREG